MAWRFYDWFTMLLLALSGFVMFALAIANAGMRYFFSSPLIWAEEISRYAMVWSTMLGVALAYRAAQHVSITVLVDIVSPRAVFISKIICHFLALATAYVLWRAGFVLVRQLGFMNAPSSEIPMAWVFAAIPAGAVLLAIEILRRLARDLMTISQERRT